MAPPAGHAPRIPAIVTNGDTNNLVRKVVCILQNVSYRSAVVSGAYNSLISFPAVKISRFKRERKMHTRVFGLDSIETNAECNSVQNCKSIAFAGSERRETIAISSLTKETVTFGGNGGFADIVTRRRLFFFSKTKEYVYSLKLSRW